MVLFEKFKSTKFEVKFTREDGFEFEWIVSRGRWLCCNSDGQWPSSPMPKDITLLPVQKSSETWKCKPVNQKKT